MRRRVVFRAIGYASAASLIVVPSAILVGEALFDHVHLGEVAVGSLIGTGFFAITAVTTGIFQNSRNLRMAVLLSYIIKTSVLLAVGMSVSLDGVNRGALALATAGSAVVYLVVQTFCIARRKRW